MKVPKADFRRSIVARFEGPAVVEGRIPVSELVRVLDDIQKAIVVVAEEIWGRQHRRGPVPERIRDQVTLELAGIRRGSFSATLQLRPIATQDGSTAELLNVGEDALEQLMAGADQELNGIRSRLPAEATRCIRDIASRVDEEITKLTLRGGRVGTTVVITGRRAAGLQVAPVTRGRQSVIGHLLEVDYKDLTGELWDATGKVTRISFAPEMVESIHAHARQQVSVTGEAELDGRGYVKKVDLTDLVGLAKPEGFWEPLTVARLAIQQGVSPVTSLQDLAGDVWPPDENVDDFVSALRDWRREDRVMP